jgi:hypothetical protein
MPDHLMDIRQRIFVVQGPLAGLHGYLEEIIGLINLAHVNFMFRCLGGLVAIIKGRLISVSMVVEALFCRHDC